uniref:Uncharacterized protein n=1 Tax=Caulobacter sp. (strain K31) TaxID=366602 RepID=B0T1E5_CAUSK
MKVVIIILVLIVIGFAVAVGVGVARGGQEPSASGAPPTAANGEIDEDALEDWKPPSVAEVMGKLARPFAPKLLKSPVQVSGQAGSGLQSGVAGRYDVDPSKKDMRIARLSLVAGTAALATFKCHGDEKEGQTCEQAVCLCASGKAFDEDDVDDCPDPWRRARTKGDKVICRDGDDASALVVYSGGGVIEVEPVAGAAATVSIR